VELFRYGLNADRYTDTITVAGADVLRWFTADPELSADRWEPNNIYGTPVDYPLEIDATISGISDMADKYLFTPATGDPLHIHFATPAMAQYFSASLYEDATDQYLGGYNWRGSTEFLLPTSGVQAYRLELFSTYGETTYHIAVDESPGYMLSGTILDGAMNPVPTAYVYSEDLNHSVLAAAGTYELGPFWPGSFEIQVYAPNHVPLPGSPFTVEFSTADVTQDIILNYSNSDNYEPNDDWTQATPITDGSHLSANVTKTTDEEDWYKFTADAGLVNVNVTFKKWTSPVGIYLFDTDGTTQLAYSALPEIPYQRIDYVLPAPGIYYVEVHGISNDYIVTVN
jgi:hypothetical protein